jgi:hypothetical protein
LREPDTISGAGDLPGIEAQIKAFVLQPGEDSREWRRDELSLWLRMVAKAHSASNRNSAPDDKPSRSIAPSSTSGVVYDSGVDPNAIKDPNVRKEYEQRLAENSQKAQQARFQSELQRLPEGWTAELKSHVSTQYSASGEDVAEIDAVLSQHVSDDEFRSRLRASLLKVNVFRGASHRQGVRYSCDSATRISTCRSDRDGLSQP